MRPNTGQDAADGGMVLRHSQLTEWRDRHPAWRLLAANNAPMILSFLSATFLEPNVRRMPRSRLVDELNDHLDDLRLIGEEHPKTAEAYIDDWAHPRTGRWLRRTHPAGEDEPLYEPTADVETAAKFCRELGPRRFVGTASRLLIIRDLLRDITVGSDTDPAARIAALQAQRDQIDEQLRAISSGQDVRLGDADVRERYAQMRQTARDLLGDLRAVEESFRDLDRDVRAKAAMWDGPRGAFLSEVFGTTHAIDATDQGRSWTAFWEHLLSHSARTELDRLLDAVETLPAVAGHTGEAEQVLRHELFAAADGTQRTVASVSAQLRRFLDDDTWAESRRISRLLRSTLALAARTHLDWIEHDRDADALPGTEVDATRATIGLPAERPLYTARATAALQTPLDEDDPAELDLSELLSLTYINLPALRAAVAETLRGRGGIASLGDVVAEHPLAAGLAELVGYLQVAGEQDADTLTTRETVTWESGELTRAADLPMVLFSDTGQLPRTGTPPGKPAQPN